jgi:hypothetical protein
LHLALFTVPFDIVTSYEVIKDHYLSKKRGVNEYQRKVDGAIRQRKSHPGLEERQLFLR